MKNQQGAPVYIYDDTVHGKFANEILHVVSLRVKKLPEIERAY